MTHTIHSVTQRQVHGDSETHTRDWVTRYWQKKHFTWSRDSRWCIDHAHIGNTYKPAAALPRAKIVLLTSTQGLIEPSGKRACNCQYRNVDSEMLSVTINRYPYTYVYLTYTDVRNSLRT